MDYECVFTQNATHALRLIADMIDWGKYGGKCVLLDINHTSMVGLGHALDKKGLDLSIVDEQGLTSILSNSSHIRSSHDHEPHSDTTFHVLLYPAQCNFSGTRYPLAWTRQFQNQSSLNPHIKSFVVLDCASYASTSPINISQDCPADFIPISLYKLFGYPTGIGCLFIRRTILPWLKPRDFFGGGTVEHIELSLHLGISHIALRGSTMPALWTNIAEQFEDGTLPFQQIIAIEPAIHLFRTLFGSMHCVASYCAYLTKRCAEALSTLKHYNNQRLVKFLTRNVKSYGDVYTQGPILTFLLKRADGSNIGYAEVERLATLETLHLRVGGLCNPGARQRYLQLTTEDLNEERVQGKICGDDFDHIDGKPTGAIRISFGPCTLYDVECQKLISFLNKYFLESTPPSTFSKIVPRHEEFWVKEIRVCKPMYDDSLDFYAYRSN